MNRKLLSNVQLFLAAIIWGFAFVAQVAGSDHIGPFTMTGFRFLLGIISLIPIILIFERGKSDPAERKRTIFASAVTGIVLFLAIVCQQVGIGLTKSAGVSSFITGLYMIFVPYCYFAIFKRKIKWQIWLGAFVALIGIFLLCFNPSEGFSFGWGELLLLIGAFFWTAQIVLIDILGKNIRSLRYSFGQFFVTAVLGIICAFIFEDVSLDLLWSAKIPLLYTGIMSVGVAFTLQVVAQKHADPNYAVIILSTESVFGAIGGALFGYDSISAVGYVGCALMFVGILFAQVDFGSLMPKRKKNELKSEYTDK